MTGLGHRPLRTFLFATHVYRSLAWSLKTRDSVSRLSKGFLSHLTFHSQRHRWIQWIHLLPVQLSGSWSKPDYHSKGTWNIGWFVVTTHTQLVHTVWVGEAGSGSVLTYSSLQGISKTTRHSHFISSKFSFESSTHGTIHVCKDQVWDVLHGSQENVLMWHQF